jgi:hypothetical protein
MELQLGVVTSLALKWSINPISSPNPVDSHSNHNIFGAKERFLGQHLFAVSVFIKRH